jgi:hypothetical protein
MLPPVFVDCFSRPCGSDFEARRQTAPAQLMILDFDQELFGFLLVLGVGSGADRRQ